MRYLDFHCDTLKLAWEKGKKEIWSFPEASVDMLRLRRSGALAQFFAAFLPPRRDADWWRKYGGEGQEDGYISSLKEILERTVRAHAEELVFAGDASGLQEAERTGKTAVFFTLEDGRSVDGKMEKLEAYKRMGISLITLTWNYENCFGAPNSRDKSVMARGLTDFGKEAVEYMNELGIVVDVSHLSDGGFWDVAGISKKPFVASHSNCRALSPHPRNLTDEMLRALAEKGGVAGLNFYSAFLRADTGSKDSRIEEMTAHVRHMVKVGGLSCAAIGTDFDGMDCRMEVPDPTHMELLFEALRKAGFSQDAVEQIAWKNAGRVLREISS